MKKKIHPPYRQTEITCSCGNKFEVGSTREKINTEVCSACHPFYTGKKKIMKTGQVERFKKRLQKQEEMMKQQLAQKKTAKTAKKSTKKASKKTTPAKKTSPKSKAVAKKKKPANKKK